MTPEETREYITKERIKAYIYFGIDAEMDMIENQYDLKTSDEPGYEKVRIEKCQEKIKYANKRIDDLKGMNND